MIKEEADLFVRSVQVKRFQKEGEHQGDQNFLELLGQFPQSQATQGPNEANTKINGNHRTFQELEEREKRNGRMNEQVNEKVACGVDKVPYFPPAAQR